MISAYIFSGPTLPACLIKERLNRDVNEKGELSLPNGERIKFLPPVSEGDILRLIPLRPKIIGIVDGYFENVPAVWHREILLAMSEGIHVLGAASMGALRAAELETFGMEGIGSVFRAFSDGLLEDDDEVTVVHGPEEQGFLPLSEAMVNIRRTLEDAARQGIIGPSEKAALLSIAKELHYKKRSYTRMLTLAGEQGLQETVLKRLRDWLPEGRQDQKLMDAAEMLEEMVVRLEKPVEPKKVLYNFESTTIWQKAHTK